MPCIKLPSNNFEDKAIILLWHTTETEAELLAILAWTTDEIARKRQVYSHSTAWRQHLSSRALLKTAEKFGIADAYFSLSHSGEYSAVAISKQKIGIDIQFITPKIARLATRFMSPDEYTQFELCAEDEKITFAALVWSAKEAMFKAWQQTKVTFKRDLVLLAPLLLAQMPQIIPARAQNSHICNNYSISFNFLFRNYSLAIALEEG